MVTFLSYHVGKIRPRNGIHTKPSRIWSVGPSCAKEGLRGVSVEVDLNPRVFDLTTPAGLVFLRRAQCFLPHLFCEDKPGKITV